MSFLPIYISFYVCFLFSSSSLSTCVLTPCNCEVDIDILRRTSILTTKSSGITIFLYTNSVIPWRIWTSYLTSSVGRFVNQLITPGDHIHRTYWLLKSFCCISQ
ncbi:hypothetical protein EDC04DRAFT_2653982 [Pisolithus marmoratus]|nr:hypothetical protein EDC04DRAFT_2653982 [Pisolithus marmoratus]